MFQRTPHHMLHACRSATSVRRMRHADIKALFSGPTVRRAVSCRPQMDAFGLQVRQRFEPAFGR